MACTLAVLLSFLFAVEPAAPARLICCGGAEVFILPAGKDAPTEADRVWRWKAADSPEIPAEHHAKFRSTDECKPVGDFILITSSSGGVALVRRADKRAVFFTTAKNAHSACLLPGRRVAVCSSFGGDELLIHSLDKGGADAPPLAKIPLHGAHGALWDKPRKRLWALGDKELLLIEIRGEAPATEIVVERKWPLPTGGGHDLSFARDGKALLLTTVKSVYRFDTTAFEFSPYPGLAGLEHVKSVDEHPATGEVVFHRGAGKNWWSDTIRFLAPARTVRLEGERLYKIRWDIDRGMPE
jgi:hypothetical protein